MQSISIVQAKHQANTGGNRELVHALARNKFKIPDRGMSAASTVMVILMVGTSARRKGTP
jgi:hypothetical protein